jgi:anti-anti-sigma regulatory factor
VQLVLLCILLILVALPFLISSLTDSNKMDPNESFGALKIIRRVSEDEVISEFLKSDFNHAIFRNYQDTLKHVVIAPNLEDALENAKRRALFFMRHLALWSELPDDVQWHEVELKDADLRQIRVFPRAQWRRVGRGNFRITDVVERLRHQHAALEDPFLSKLESIQKRLCRDDPGVSPVILIGLGEHAPFTILDGNHRLVAAMLGPVSRVESLRFFLGRSPKMTECSWYNTNHATLIRYARDVLRGSFRHPEAELDLLLSDSDLASIDAAASTPASNQFSAQEGETMSIPIRNVIVKRLPQAANGRQGRAFLREISKCACVDRPRLVLDCSDLRCMDKSVVHLLLCCLEEAMKRNGDARLAALPIGAHEVLATTGADRVFEIYDSAAEAMNSFHRAPAASAASTVIAVRPDLESESAA